MPKSEDVANQFMSEGRTGSSDNSDCYPANVACPEDMGQMGPFNASGSIPVVPEGVVYNPSVPTDPSWLRAPDWYKERILEEQHDNDADDAKGK